jgi:deoxyadenosine/deoxycytidine kinase
MTASLISIIGPPAAGKTTLAQALCADLGATLILEDYAGNPFLADSYVGKAEARLPGQLCFLMSRVGQLSIASWPEAGIVVSDYGFCQDGVYAKARLSADEFRLYRRLATRMEGLVHGPQIVIHLDASEATLLNRIAARGRDFETVMDRTFLSAMREAYKTLVGEIGCPVLAIDCDGVDLREPAARAKIVQRVQELLAAQTFAGS